MTIKNFMRKFDALSPEKQKRTFALFGPPCCTEFMGNHERMQRLLSWRTKQMAQEKMWAMLDRIMRGAA